MLYSLIPSDDHVNICSLSPLYSVTQEELIKAQNVDELFKICTS